MAIVYYIAMYLNVTVQINPGIFCMGFCSGKLLPMQMFLHVVVLFSAAFVSYICVGQWLA